MAGLTDIQEFFRLVLQASPFRIAVIDREGRFQYANQITTISEEELQKKFIWDYLNEQDTAEIKKHLTHVFASGERVAYINQAINPLKENRLSWYRNVMAPLIINGRSDFVVISFEVIDEYKEKEEEINTKQAQLSAIINNTNDIILSIDEEYNIIVFNEALKKLVKQGFDKDLCSGTPVFDVIKMPAKEKLIQIYEQVFKGEKITMVDEFRGLGDRVIYYETSYNPIYTNNHISGISIFSRDISSDKEDESKLRHALKEKETLLSEIHHRVKNNLAAISSIIQLHLLNTDNPEIMELLGTAMNRLKSSALVHEMLYENDSLSLINFREYTQRLCKYLQDGFVDSTKRIKISLEAESCVMNIKQAIPCGLILNELITNAFKHGFVNREEGNINIKIRHHDHLFLLEVSNDGEQIAGDFDPFETNSISIGMILIQTLTQQLDGQILLEKTPVTKFTLNFNFEPEE